MKKLEDVNSLISIIVPVYNVQEYLPKCLDSIINQTYKNLEIILVDDGSTDNSGRICDEYAKRDKRIKFIRQKNSGQANARNKGIKESKGKYIAFVDSDDWIDEDFIETLEQYISNDNIVCCGYKEIYDDKIVENKISNLITINKIEFLKLLNKFEINKIFSQKTVNPIGNYLWNKIYPASILEKIDISTKHKYEDIYIMFELILKVSTVTVLPIAKYNYLKRANSTVNTVSKNFMFDYVNARLKQEKDIFFNKEILNSCKVLTLAACMSLYSENLKENYFLNNEELNYVRRMINDRKNLIKIKNTKFWLKIYILKYFPQLMMMLYKIKRGIFNEYKNY